MKKLSVLLLSFFMFLAIGSPIQAESNVNQDLLNELYGIDPEIQRELEGEEIISVTKKEKIILESPVDSQIAPMGLIPTNKMSLYITVSKGQSNNYTVKATSTWKSKPIFKFKDTMAISWGNNHTLKSSSIRLNLHNGKTSTESQIGSVTPNVGISRVFKTQHVDRFFGNQTIYTSPKTATLTAVINTNGTKGSTNIAAGYAHKTLGLPDVGVSFDGKGASFSFSGKGVKFDHMYNYTHFNH